MHTDIETSEPSYRDGKLAFLQEGVCMQFNGVAVSLTLNLLIYTELIAFWL